MITKSITVSLLVPLFFSMLTAFSSAGEPRKEEIVASVTTVVHPKNAIADTVTLTMTVHTPSDLGGFQFQIVTESKERAKVRAEFPVGSLQTLVLPTKISEELKKQIKAHASVEKTLDRGIDPMMISQVFLLPAVSILELPQRPVALLLGKQAEQGGAGQSPTRPESK